MVWLEIILILLLAALVSGVGAWLLGRPLRHAAQDPALVEKLARHRARLLMVGILLAAGLSMTLATAGYLEGGFFADAAQMVPSVLVALLVVGLGVAAGNFPLRRALFDERWTVFEYLVHLARITLGTLGFWLLLLGTPFLILAARPWAWAAAGAFFVVLLVWGRYYNTILPFVLGARPLDDPVLRARFERILARSTAPCSRILCAANDKGSWSNAFALPDRKAPGVLFTRPLLARLNPDEAAAIFAHEVAHLEDFDAAKLRRLSRYQTLLIATACLAPLLIVAFSNAVVNLFLWAWMPFVLLIVLRYLKNQQHKETESDLRAVDLCGDADAVIRGLVKVHTANRLPRRMAVAVERQASHPSLARRIQAVRRYAAPLAADPAGDADAEPSGDGALDLDIPFWAERFVSRNSDRELLILGRERVHWLRLPPDGGNGFAAASPWSADRLHHLRCQAVAERTVAYAGLIELRLVVKGRTSTLRAVENTGAVTTFPIKDEDHAALQQSLDRVDGQLAPPSAPGATIRFSMRLACLLIALGSLLATPHGVLSVGSGLWVALICLIAASVPHRPWMAAAGSVALLAAAQPVFRPEMMTGSGAAWLAPLGLGAAGLWVLWKTVSHPRETPDPFAVPDGKPIRVAVVLLGLATPFLVPHLAALAAGDALRALYLWGTNAPGSFFPLLAAGAALGHVRHRAATGGALALGMLSLSSLFLGSTFFLARVAKDPLAAETPPLTLDTAPYRVVREATVAPGQWGLQLSPEGSRFFTQTIDNYAYEDYEANRSATFRVADFDGHAATLTALQLAFLDEDRLLALRKDKGGHLGVHVLSASDPEAILWRLALPDLNEGVDARLTTDGERWRVVSGYGGDTLYRFTGHVGADTVARTAWERPGWANTFLGQGAYQMEMTRGGPEADPMAGLPGLGLFRPSYPYVTLRLTDPAGSRPLATSVLPVDCKEPNLGRSDVLCLASSRNRIWVWAADLEAGAFDALARLASPESLVRGGYHTWDWDGRRLTLLQSQHLLLLDPRQAAGVRIPLPEKAGWDVTMASTDGAVALGWPDDGAGFRVVLLKTPFVPPSNP